uniref:Bacterial mobilisation domain-containing protein n=2 Tax=Streptococcus pneumoniae TaxID=1313 RepID=Q54884_STREE|nr:unknown [Streptococcus pneumoniae]
MEHRYRTNLKKVFLSDLELVKLNENISKSNCLSFSEYARRTTTRSWYEFYTIDTNSYQDLIFELKRIGNNINQIARSINYSNLITEVELNELRKGIEELIVEVEKDFLIRSEKLRKFYGHH